MAAPVWPGAIMWGMSVAQLRSGADCQVSAQSPTMWHLVQGLRLWSGCSRQGLTQKVSRWPACFHKAACSTQRSALLDLHLSLELWPLVALPVGTLMCLCSLPRAELAAR